MSSRPHDGGRSAADDSGAPHVLLVGGGSGPDALSSALAAAGIGLEHCADAAAAVRACSSAIPDAVVIDLSGRAGPEACAALAALECSARVPRLVLLAGDDLGGAERAYEAGANDVLARPVNAAFLALRLGRLAGGAEREGPACRLDRATGLADREELLVRVARAAEQALADGSRIALIYLELDRFRELANGLASTSAANLLGTVARRLREGIRDSDLVADLSFDADATTIARVGGGEFCLLIQGLERVEDAAKAGRRLLDALADPFAVEGQSLSLGASVGIATFPEQSLGPGELLDCAQTAAYSARQDGRETIRFYASSMNAKAFERLTLETSLRAALEREEFLVYYQPRIEIASGRIIGMEALLRWRHPQLGLVSPSQFIPLAEETGLIVPIGEYVLQRACRQNREWQRRGLPMVAVSVNLSSVQFQRPELYDQVVRTLGEAGLDPIWLELELTESLLMQNAEAVVATLKRFRDTGIKLSIDDFGTGYSSLSYLKRFPIDALKIDRSFIREVTTNADDAALATSIILMGRSLKLKVVAEGVETASQLSFLRIMQCDEAQGFLYSPPVPADDAARMLREGPPRVAAA
jgi:diguanylate cyclase (GGDEF)-like protein